MTRIASTRRFLFAIGVIGVLIGVLGARYWASMQHSPYLSNDPWLLQKETYPVVQLEPPSAEVDLDADPLVANEEASRNGLSPETPVSFPS